MLPHHELTLGREKELAEIEGAWHAALNKSGSLILVSGEEGAGKTHLISEAVARCSCPVFSGRAREEAVSPYRPLAAAMRDCLRFLPDNFMSGNPLQRYLGILLPELGETSGDSDVDPEALNQAVISLFSEATRREPPILFLDDLHWADNATLDLLPVLADSLASERLLIVAAYRSDEITRSHPIRRMRNELRRSRGLHEMTVGPLSRTDTTEFVRRIIGSVPDEHVISTIYDQTHGIPLYVEELTQALKLAGRLEAHGDTVTLIEGATVPVPESIRDAILLRVKSLSTEARNQLEVAAVLGMEFDFDVLTSLSGSDRGLEELLDRNLIVETGRSAGAFRHAMIREAVRLEITWTRRRTLHRQIGEYLESIGSPPHLQADHWLAARESVKARRALVESARLSCQMHAYRDSAEAFNKALSVWPEGEDEGERLNAVERLAQCAQVNGQLSDAIRCWREVVESPLVASDHTRLGNAYRSLAAVYGLQGAWDLAIQSRLEAADELQAAGLIGDAAAELLSAGSRQMATLQLTAALHTAGRAVELADKAGKEDILVRAMGLEGDILAQQGEYQKGRDRAQQALSQALEHNLSEAASDVYRRLASTLTYAADYSGAREAYTTAIDFCRDRGVEVQAQVCMSCLSYVLFHTGDWKRAADVSRELLQRDTTPVNSRVTAEGMLGLIQACRGETKQARKTLNRALSAARNLQIGPMELLVLWGLGIVAEYDNDIKTARAVYDSLIERWQSTQDHHDVVPGLCAATAFFARQELEAETAHCAQALSDIAAHTGNPEALAGLASALGESAFMNGNIPESANQFRQAWEHHQSLNLPFELAHSGMRLGETLILDGRTDEGVEYLVKAYRTAKNLGARPLAARIASVLERHGYAAEESRDAESPRRAEAAGLTRRQQEIARLMADGLTNKEIATRLFLSPRTVDMHVSNILNRLDCRSRTEAVRKASDLGILG